LKAILAFAGTVAFQGSIKWWVLRHRLHHRYTDTDHDPYNAKRGFWFSHIGWIFETPRYTKMKLVDASDLNADSIVQFQHRNYVPLALLSGFVFPAVLGVLWGDALGSFLYAGYVSRIAIWHATFSINR
jgi:stearoyl-CoA desaturase (delta-9 desaturase)